MRKYVVTAVFTLLTLFALAACGGGEETKDAASSGAQQETVALVGDAANGGKVFSTACVACHGPEAKGITGLGKDLTTSEWVGQQSDAQLVEFIKKGRDAGDPLNTTGVAMPPKGGNPAMSDQEVADIVAFLRSIHQQ